MIFQQPESSFDPVTTIGKQFCEALGVHEKYQKKEALGRGMELLKNCISRIQSVLWIPMLLS